ncbi:MAG: hypothetical protein KKB20_30625 [Proteobacteria bacterium]|nr:hypothetical protein [Pseudomonadota bacterium]
MKMTASRDRSRPLLPRLLLLLLAAAAALSACNDAATGADGGGDGSAGDAGDAGGVPSILPFAAGSITVMVNQPEDVWVNLSRPASVTTYVDVGNLSASYLGASPTALIYTKGEDQQPVTITGVQVTSDKYVPVRFTVRGTKQVRTLQVKVKLW